jgi:hypothetical protein
MHRTLVVVNAITVLGLWGLGLWPRRQDPAPPTASLKVRELLLVDEAGRTRARLGITDGMPGLTFHTEDGSGRLKVGFVSATDTGLTAFDKRGAQRAELRCRDGGTSSLVFTNSTGANGIRLLALDGGHAALELTHTMGGSAELRAISEGQPDLTLSDAQGRLRASLGVNTSGLSCLTLFDQKNGNEAAFYVPREGPGGLSLVDQQRRPRLVLGAPFDPRTRAVGDGSPAAIELRDENGRAVWQAPR